MSQELPFIWQFSAGAIAGVSEICLMYPLDGLANVFIFLVIKTRLQLETTRSSQSVFSTIEGIIKNEGALRLYRGILPPIFVEAPKRATKFAAYEQFSGIYKRLFNTTNHTMGLALLTGISAGLTEACIVVPFELVKIRLQDKANVGKYKDTFSCVRQILYNEGPFAFYRGLESTLWRHGAWNGGYFGAIHLFRTHNLMDNYISNKKCRDFVTGAVGGTIGTVLNTPFDVVKTRIQNAAIPSKYVWTLPSLRIVVKEEGFFALYKGFVPKVLRLGPGGGVLLVVYETITSIMKTFYVKNN